MVGTNEYKMTKDLAKSMIQYLSQQEAFKLIIQENTAIVFKLPLLNLLKEQITIIVIDVTYKSNQFNYELYAILGIIDRSGFPLIYLFLKPGQQKNFDYTSIQNKGNMAIKLYQENHTNTIVELLPENEDNMFVEFSFQVEDVTVNELLLKDDNTIEDKKKELYLLLDNVKVIIDENVQTPNAENGLILSDKNFNALRKM
ncbi:5545_t:CDS:2, partial [Gigaspora rosea]